MIKTPLAADLSGQDRSGGIEQCSSNEELLQSDSAFDRLYPADIEAKSQKHWTPLAIARRAAQFLAEPEARVLDIGSGVGKFCLAAAHCFPNTLFYGIEQRHELVLYAEDAKSHLQLANVHFIYGNVTQINFNEFDHFYFYNAFYENVDDKDPIDDAIATSYSLYQYYTQYLFAALDQRPSGTKLVTYHSLEEVVPASYALADVSYDTLLKMWIMR